MTDDRLRAPTPAEMAAAAEVVAAHLAPTPLVATELPTPHGPLRGWLKLETAQPTGSFKVRGALAALASLPAGAHAVSASAGNHGLGMCLAAALLGRRVTVVVPTDASPAKLAAIERLASAPGAGATLVRFGSGYEAAERHARARVADDPAAVYVSAYSDASVVAGQGTLVAEVEAQLRAAGAPGHRAAGAPGHRAAGAPGHRAAGAPGHRAAGEGATSEGSVVVVPLGGGGLASGVGLAVATRPGWHLFAAEVEASLAVSTAVAAGRLVDVAVGASLADGLLGNLEGGSPTPAILGGLVAAGQATLIAITERQLRAAMRWAFSEHGLVVEGAGAAGIAAVTTGAVVSSPGQEAVVVVSGRNVTGPAFAEVIAGDP